MLRERVAPQSEVIRVIILEDSPCCEVPHRDVLAQPRARRRCRHARCSLWRGGACRILLAGGGHGRPRLRDGEAQPGGNLKRPVAYELAERNETDSPGLPEEIGGSFHRGGGGAGPRRNGELPGDEGAGESRGLEGR